MNGHAHWSLWLKLFFITGWTCFNGPVWAVDLVTVYHDALQNDQTFQEKQADWLVAQEKFPQNLANLLPTLQLTGSTTHYHLQSVGNPTTRYNNHQYSLTLTQPIINFTNWVNVQVANSDIKSAKASFEDAKQDLILRTAQAYFNILKSEDNLRSVQKKKMANLQQLKQAQQKYQVGLDTITSYYEAKANYDATVAEEISVISTLKNDNESLLKITGRSYDHLDPFKKNLALVFPNPPLLCSWITAAKLNNLSLIGARFDLASAKEKIHATFGGHLPTVSVVGTYNNNNQNAYLTSPLIDSKTKSVSLQTTVPLFSGGSVISQTRQAEANFQKALATLEKLNRSTIADTRQTYNNIVSGISKIQADNQSVLSYQSSLDSAKASYSAGTRTIVDVLSAQKDLYTAQQTLAEDFYSYLTNLLTLKQDVGALTEQDLNQINQWLLSKNEVVVENPPVKPAKKIPVKLHKKKIQHRV